MQNQFLLQLGNIFGGWVGGGEPECLEEKLPPYFPQEIEPWSLVYHAAELLSCEIRIMLQLTRLATY